MASSYDIKDLDAESVSLAIDKCLPLLSDEELSTLANYFDSTAANEIKPDFITGASKDIRIVNRGKIITVFSGTTTSKMYSSQSKKSVQSNFDALKDIIAKIKKYIDNWQVILEEPPKEIEEVEDIEEEAGSNEEETMDDTAIQILAIDEDTIGVDIDGNPVNIPKGEYEILDVQEVNGETFIKIVIDGKEYWIKYMDGAIVGYTLATAAPTDDSNSDDSNNNNHDYSWNEEPNSDLFVYINGVAFVLAAGTYTVVAYYEMDGKKYAVVLIDGKYYQVEVDADGNIVSGSTADVLPGSYTVVDDDITIEVNGQTITIKKGRYKILATKEVDGETYGLVCIDGIYYWVLLDANGNIVPSSNADLTEPTTVVIVEPTPIQVGEEEVVIEPGEYEIIEIRIIDGKKYGLICIDGVYYWVPLDENGNIIPGGEAIPAETNNAEITENLTIIVDGNEVTITPGQYTIIDVQTINGKTYGLVLINGKYYWVPLDGEGNIVPGGTAISVTETNYTLKDTLTFVIDGETITVVPGEYQIVKIITTPDGGYAYCIFVNGKHVWVYFDKDGNFLYSMIDIEKEGMYNITEQLDILDENGNIIGKTDQYMYHIYAIRYDEFGNIVAIRISPPGYPEQWIIVRRDGQQNGTYTPLEEGNNNDPNKPVKYSTFKNKKVLLGCLIGLAAVLGAAIIYKKKKGSEEVEESFEVEDGEYPVFEESLDDDGNVDAVRISNDDSDDEYWMEVR